MKNKVFVFLWILFLYGCTDKETQQNFQDIHKINKKMHFQEAIKIMRNPPIKIWNNPSKNVFFMTIKIIHLEDLVILVLFFLCKIP